MYEQQDNRDLDQNDVSNARYPHESSQHEPITKMDSLFRLFLLCLDRIIQYHRSFVLTFPMTFV